MGYQNSTFPIAVYGCMDTCSRKMLWTKVWVSNSNPDINGRFYLEYLFKLRIIASKLRLDKASETGVMATMHAFLRQHHGDMDPLDTVMYGPSTSNQVCSCSVFLVLPLVFVERGQGWKGSQLNIKDNFFKNNLVLYSVLFRFDHICRRDQCAVYILCFKISTDPDLIIHE